MSTLSRRTFLGLVGAGGAGAGVGFWFGQSLPQAGELLMPAVLAPEDVSPGLAQYYASACTLCPAGCGIVVKTREGRAKKIEGNPGHPVNQGGLCARGQAGLTLLYHPDRLQTPMRRRFERGRGVFEPASWDEALTAIAKAIAPGSDQPAGAGPVLVSGHLPAGSAVMVEAFFKALGRGEYGVLPERLLTSMPDTELANIAAADVVISLGADVLGSGTDRVRANRLYGEFRQGTDSSARGRWWQLEARMSLTGANADVWLPLRPGSEWAVLSLVLAEVMKKASDPALSADWQVELTGIDVPRCAELTELPTAQLQTLVDAVLDAKAPLLLLDGAAGSSQNAERCRQLMDLLKQRLPALAWQRSSDPMLPTTVPPIEAGRWQTYAERSQRDELPLLMLADCDPLYLYPHATAVKTTFEQAGLVVALDTLPNDSQRWADWVLPLPTYLEQWELVQPQPGVGFRAASLAQPVVAPLYDTKSLGEVLIALAERSGVTLPWPDQAGAIRQFWQDLYDRRQTELTTTDFDLFWQQSLQAGIWGDGAGMPASPRAPADAPAPIHGPPAASAGSLPYHLHLYAGPSRASAFDARLPWLAELPDAMTGVVYQSVLELNPQTARELGLVEGDLVRVQSAAGSVELPVLPYPGIRPGTVALAIGMGQHQGGRYAAGKGVNAWTLVGNEEHFADTRVSITKLGRRIELLRVGKQERAEGRDLFGQIPVNVLDAGAVEVSIVDAGTGQNEGGHPA